MTGNDDFEQRLRDHLSRRAPVPPFGLLDGLLRQTAVLPQRRRVLAFSSFAWLGLGAATAAVLLVAALRTALPGPSTPPGGQVSPSASAEQSMTVITIPSPAREKAIMLQAQDVMSARLRALGIGTFTATAGIDLTFSFVLPPSVDAADVETVLNTSGNIEWLAWSEAPWPVEGDPVRDDVFPLFDASDQILSATVQPASGSSSEGVVISLGPVAAEAIATYTSAHVGEPAMPLALDGIILTAPFIQSPITSGDLIITFPTDDPISPRALAAILSSGPLPPAWTASPQPSPQPLPSSSPFSGTLEQLLREADQHIGSRVHVTGDVGSVAEGGPMLTLTHQAHPGEILVLLDTRLNGGEYSLDYAVDEPAVVDGTLLELTAENIDSIGNTSLDGEDVIRFYEGVRYLLIASTVVQ